MGILLGLDQIGFAREFFNWLPFTPSGRLFDPSQVMKVWLLIRAQKVPFFKASDSDYSAIILQSDGIAY